MNTRYILLISLFFILINCSKDDDKPVLSNKNQIISFVIYSNNSNSFEGEINNQDKEVVLHTYGIELANLIVPSIEISDKATISPSPDIAQDFSSDVEYTVTAENGDKAIYSVSIINGDNKITSFIITPHETSFVGEIDDELKIVSIETIGLEQTSSLIPDIEISTNATISPGLQEAQNFNNSIVYTVTAQNGNQVAYEVITNNTSLISSEKKILSFQMEINGVIHNGVIDNDQLIVVVFSDEDVSNITPVITISENASIIPDTNQSQDFSNPVEYIVYAEDGSSNTYSVFVRNPYFYSLNIGSGSSTFTSYFVRARPKVRGNFIDLTLPNSKIVLENEINSYVLDYENYVSIFNSFGVNFTSFYINFSTNILSASDYKLKYKVNDQIITETDFLIDVLAENAPDLISANQTLYQRYDTLILTGSNLSPKLAIAAKNGSVYIYNSSFVSVNSDNTELTMALDVNPQMFPSYYGDNIPHPTPVVVMKEGRYGEAIILDFL